MIIRRVRHVLRYATAASNSEIVGRAVLDALRSDRLADLLLSNRILISSAGAAFTNSDGHR